MVLAPHFKRPEDQLIAYAWAVELAEASRHLLYEFAQEYRLGYFAESSEEADTWASTKIVPAVGSAPNSARGWRCTSSRRVWIDDDDQN